MEKYDPHKSPNPDEWLELDEQERILLARAYHKPMQEHIPSMETHAIVHAIVENQLAEGLKEAQDALQRLMAEGLDRHDAIHAIGSVLLEHIAYVMRKKVSGKKANKRYDRRLKALTVDNWMALADESD